LVENFGVEEKRAVLAHEIARIHHEAGFADRIKVAIGAFPDMLTAVLGDFLASIALAFIILAMMALVVAFPPFVLYVFTGDYGQLAAYFLMLGIFGLFMLYSAASSARNDPRYNRERFYQADRLAVKWTMYPEVLVSALLAARKTVPERSRRYMKLMAFVPAESYDPGGTSSTYRPPRTLYFPTVRMRIERLEKTLKTSLD
jgi:Zn-dependent protease with chaperone function